MHNHVRVRKQLLDLAIYQRFCASGLLVIYNFLRKKREKKFSFFNGSPGKHWVKSCHHVVPWIDFVHARSPTLQFDLAQKLSSHKTKWTFTSFIKSCLIQFFSLSLLVQRFLLVSINKYGQHGSLVSKWDETSLENHSDVSKECQQRSAMTCLHWEHRRLEMFPCL